MSIKHQMLMVSYLFYHKSMAYELAVVTSIILVTVVTLNNGKTLSLINSYFIPLWQYFNFTLLLR